MKITKLTETLSVGDQITPADVAAIAQAGFKTIINNRPDGEEDDQPLAETIGDAASDAGLAYFYQPVVSNRITNADVHSFARNINNANQPVLAFCRTGTRCTTLWILNNKHNPDKALKIAKEAGYDLSHLRKLFGK